MQFRLGSIRPNVVVLECTGSYKQNPYIALEAVGIVGWVVKSRHAKAVQSLKTDLADVQWLASLVRAGLLKNAFIAKADLHCLRHIACQRPKLGRTLASEKNRLRKLLTVAGGVMGVVASGLHGQSACAMVQAIIAQKSIPEIRSLASKRLRDSREDIFEASQGEEVTPAHCICLAEIMSDIEELDSRKARFDSQLIPTWTQPDMQSLCGCCRPCPVLT